MRFSTPFRPCFGCHRPLNTFICCSVADPLPALIGKRANTILYFVDGNQLCERQPKDAIRQVVWPGAEVAVSDTVQMELRPTARRNRCSGQENRWLEGLGCPVDY